MGSGWGVSKTPTSKPHMTHLPHPQLLQSVLQLLSDEGSDGFAESLRLLVNEAMQAERSHALQAQPFERTDARLGHANGFKPKTLKTRLGAITFAVPQVRGEVEFYPSALDKGIRSEQALKLALAEMYVQGVSTRKVAAILEELCGTSVSSTHVSQCAARLDADLQAWRTRPLSAFAYVLIDARYEKVRHGGRVLDCAVLIALGLGPDGKRTILGVSVALSEAEVHWRDFLTSLQKRGLCALQLLVSDDHAGLAAARRAVFPAVPWQRCQFHLQQNAQAYVPRLDLRAQVAADIRSVFACADRPSAERRLKELVTTYSTPAPKLASWMETALPEGFTVFAFPTAHQRRLRTSNALERVNQELKRRTRVASIFPNEASLLRLVSAILAETSDDWESSNTYLDMNPSIPPSA
jgi:putative transposase